MDPQNVKGEYVSNKTKKQAIYNAFNASWYNILDVELLWADTKGCT